MNPPRLNVVDALIESICGYGKPNAVDFWDKKLEWIVFAHLSHPVILAGG